MNKTYIYPRFNLFVLISSVVVICLLAMVVKGFFAEAVGAKNLLPKLIAAIIGLYFALCAGWILVNRIVAVAAIRKVITRDEAVTIQNLFSSRTIRWEDITEFGTYTVGFHGSGVST